MTKKLHDENVEELFDCDIDCISIEEIDKEIQDFYIDREKIDSIKVPENKNDVIREAMNRAKSDMKAQRRRKNILAVASSISVILCIGIYSPALAHSLPPVEKALQSINDTLMVDEIASYTGINKVLPKVVVDNEGNMKFDKPTEYKVNKSDEDIDKPNKLEDGNKEADNENHNNSDENNKYKDYNVEAPLTEYSAVQLIHQMSNSIIKAIDDRKFGEIPVTPFNIDQAIEGIKYIQDEGSASYLQNALLKWKEGDFSNAVLVHNFVWEMLDGEIGKAISVNNKRVEQIKNKYYK